ncbi:uncharacterized protein BDW70DRAFT_154618 [Aspergillus foveolatus]|uniref:uncharacterized protein n=1 Tax=Aspergillus foveolatus TaxID=210207 RepID=UPI003CCE5222
MASINQLPEYPHNEALSPHSRSARYNAHTKTLEEQSGVQAAVITATAWPSTTIIWHRAIRSTSSLGPMATSLCTSLSTATFEPSESIRGMSSGENEIYTSFPDSIVQEVHTTTAIQYWAPRSYTVHIGGVGLDVDVPGLSAPNALAYRVSRNNDGMFGAKVDTTLNY